MSMTDQLNPSLLNDALENAVRVGDLALINAYVTHVFPRYGAVMQQLLLYKLADYGNGSLNKEVAEYCSNLSGITAQSAFNYLLSLSEQNFNFTEEGRLKANLDALGELLIKAIIEIANHEAGIKTTQEHLISKIIDAYDPAINQIFQTKYYNVNPKGKLFSSHLMQKLNALADTLPLPSKIGLLLRLKFLIKPTHCYYLSNNNNF
jgi:hypothetical protein